MTHRSRFARALIAAVSFAALWGALTSLLAATTVTGPGAWPLGLVVVVSGLFGSLGALIALSLARRWMQQVFDDLRDAVRASDRSGGALAGEAAGWAAFDAVVSEFDRLARLRALRIGALTRQEARFRALADSTHSVEAWFDRTGSLVWISRSVERVSGYSRAECLLAPSLIELMVPLKDRPQLTSLGRSALAGEGRSDFEIRIQRKDGGLRWVACHWVAMKNADGRMLGVRLSVEDIQARKDVEARLLDTVAELRRAQALTGHYLQRTEDERLRLVSLLDTLRVGILFVDRDRRVYYCNHALREMWGFAPDENLTGLRDEALIERSAALRADDTAYHLHLDAVLSRQASSPPYEIPLSDGRVLEEVSALVSSDDGARRIGRVWVYEDVTERKHTAQRLIEMAEHDALTGLYNRRRFHEELDRMLAVGQRHGEQVALLSFDLDGFKLVNDRFGHQAGDKVLVGVAEGVAAIVRRNELLFRLGGDEFAVLVPEARPEEVMTLAQRINRSIASQRFSFDDGVASVGVSIGVALFPQHARVAEALIEAADTALYAAKAAGKGTQVLYQPPA
ncbi:diguanylate cyclase [Niveibacterium sp.]|uniref:diguanylate cyclase n=1 Tax=Niveibacterium sp. TaxID=2017444 RepID=UPI0035B1F0BD